MLLVKISCLLRSNGFNRKRLDLRKQALPFWQCSNIGPWSVCTQTTFYVHQLVRENVSGECVDWQLNETSCGLKITSQIWFNGMDMREDESGARKTCSVTTVHGIVAHGIMESYLITWDHTISSARPWPNLAQGSHSVKCNGYVC